MVELPFTKMQGLGNDFVVIDHLDSQRDDSPEITPDLAKKICDRRFGVGADQILWLKKPLQSGLDARMEILNADGTSAEMCGNGIRAVAVYLRDQVSADQKSRFSIETLAGLIHVQIQGNQVEVNMGSPRLGPGFFPKGEVIEVLGKQFSFYEVSMGNPHAVIFVDEVAGFPVEEIGSLLEVHPRFPSRTNVEFVQVMNSNAIQVRVWERGAGITLACGTGACAAAVASIASGRTQDHLEVRLPGGHLRISWSKLPTHSDTTSPNSPQAPVMMTGPAAKVFRGVYWI